MAETVTGQALYICCVCERTEILILEVFTYIMVNFIFQQLLLDKGDSVTRYVCGFRP
jgi:hypothetical protein